jgi:hypothetical protein
MNCPKCNDDKLVKGFWCVKCGHVPPREKSE